MHTTTAIIIWTQHHNFSIYCLFPHHVRHHPYSQYINFIHMALWTCTCRSTDLDKAITEPFISRHDIYPQSWIIFTIFSYYFFQYISEYQYILHYQDMHFHTYKELTCTGKTKNTPYYNLCPIGHWEFTLILVSMCTFILKCIFEC